MIGEVRDNDHEGLMTLYMQLHDNPLPENQTAKTDLWRKVLADERHHIITAREDGKVVSSRVCVVILNLTHAQRPHVLTENVITDSGHRKKGLVTACLHYAKEIMVNGNCYKIMLLTGAKMESTLNFYEQADYNRNDKIVFVRWLRFTLFWRPAGVWEIHRRRTHRHGRRWDSF